MLKMKVLIDLNIADSPYISYEDLAVSQHRSKDFHSEPKRRTIVQIVKLWSNTITPLSI